MTLLKNLLGNGGQDKDGAEANARILQEMQQERSRFQSLIERGNGTIQKLETLGEPVARASDQVDAVTQRLAALEQRLASITELASVVQSLDGRVEGLQRYHQEAESRAAATFEEVQRIRSVFETLSEKADLAAELQGKLERYLESEKPFEQLCADTEGLRGQVEGVGEQLGRFREQQERLVDQHKLSMSKMEALDRRRDVLGRELADKERRVATVEQAVRGMDGIQHTVDELRREIGTLKALGDTVVQKAAALEAQREAVERALSQAEHLERAMRQVDAGVRQQQDNEKALSALLDHVTELKSLHEAVVERSSEIAHLQRETDERTRATREDLGALGEEMKKTVERFDYESRGLETVSQRVADLRAALTDCEGRFKALNEPSTQIGEVKARAKSLGGHIQSLTEQVGRVDREVEKFVVLRRDLDQTAQVAQELAAHLAHIEDRRPAFEAAQRDLADLAGAHAAVKDALEQSQIAQSEIARLRGLQSETRQWLDVVDRSLGELRERTAEVQNLAPTIDVVQKQAQRLAETTSAIESRREFVDDLHRKTTELGALSARLDEREKNLQSRMEAAEQRFLGLSAHADEAERLSQTIAGVTSGVVAAERKSDQVTKAVAAIAKRCDAIEELAEKTRTLKPELDQRQQSLAEALTELQRAATLRKDAATQAQKLDELVKKLTGGLATADRRAASLDELASQLERRGTHLETVEKRMAAFEERLSSWDPVEAEIDLSLEQITARLGTVEALKADLDRMFAMAEKTATDVRDITSAHSEIDQSKKLLTEVMGRLDEMKNTADALDERKRQMTKAEERLARAEALLADVGSSLDALQGQKAIVDQAVEKAGSLQFLLKQAESTIEGLREEREVSARVRPGIAVVRRDDEAAEDETKTKAA